MSADSSTPAGTATPARYPMSANSFASTGLFAPAGLWAPINVPTPAGLVSSLYAGLPVVQGMTKPFFIRKSITTLNNTTAQMYIKAIILISGI